MRILLAIATLFLTAACGQNPVLGDWEIDPADNGRSVLVAVEATDMEQLTFRADGISSEDTEIPVSYVVEDGQVRVVRDDGRGEHRVELLEDGRIRVELPIQVTAVYRRPGS